MKLRVVFAGTPAFAVPPLLALHAAHDMAGVLSQPDRPSGRGRAVTASPVKQRAMELSLPVLQPARLRGDAAQLDATLAQLHAWQPDVMVVVAYGLILPPAVLQLPRLGCLNIHASLLPRWRGAAPIQRAILAGDATTGVSIMQMDEGLDTGEVLREARVAIDAEATSAVMHERLATLGAEQVILALEDLSAGRAQPQPQTSTGVTYAEKLAKAEARIDWRQEASRIDRQIRAFNPWPVAETTLAGEPVKFWRSRMATSGHSAAPGTVLGLRDAALEVACGTGTVQILELQRAGRKAVSARDFLNATHATDGAPLVFQ